VTVLIADNDRAVSGLLTDILGYAGLTVVHAYDGAEAMGRVREAGVAVVVCDLDMPKVSGVEVVESMADLPCAPQVLVISGFLDGATERRLRALPYVRDVLKKPFDLLAFAARVRALVGGEAAGPAADASASAG